MIASALLLFTKWGVLEEKVRLSNGRMDSSFEGKALIKIGKDNSTLKPLGADLKKKDQSTVILIVPVLLSSSVL